MGKETLDSQNFLFNKERSKKYLLAMMAVAQYGSSLDEIFWTPLRDLQVFGKKVFSSGFGPGHNFLNIASVVTGMIASLPFLFKVFNKNETNALHEVLYNSKVKVEIFTDAIRDEKIKYKQLSSDGITQLETYFKNHLRKQGIFGIQPKILEIEKKDKLPPRRTQYHYDVKYEFSESIGNLLNNHSELAFKELVKELFGDNITTPNDLKACLFEISELDADEKPLQDVLNSILELYSRCNKEKAQMLEQRFFNAGLSIEKIIAFSKIVPLFLKDKNQENILTSEFEQEYDCKMTLESSRQNFLKNVNKISLRNIGDGTYDFLNDSAFHFWLGFAVVDIFKNQADTRQWHLKEQLIVVGLGLVGGLAKALFSIGNYFVNKLSSSKKNDKKETETLLKKQNQMPSVNASVKHKQLEYLFTQLQYQNYKKNTKIPENDRYKDRVKKILDTKNFTNAKKSIWQKFAGFFKEHDSVRAHVKTLRDYINTDQFIESSVAAEIAGKGVAFSFFQWFASAAIFSALLWHGAKSTALKVGAFLNDGLTGPIIALGSFVLGMVVGGSTFFLKTNNTLQTRKDEIRKSYEKNKSNIASLEKIEEQNARLENLARDNNVSFPTLLKPHDDRGHRRITTEKTPIFTAFKKAVNRFSVAVGKAGSGILIYRLLPMVAIPLLPHIPALAHVAFIVTVSTAVSAVAWPAMCVAMGIGAIWAGVFTYRYIKERKLAASERFINDVDNRLKLAKKNQNILLTALGCGQEFINDVKKTRKGESIVEINGDNTFNASKAIPAMIGEETKDKSNVSDSIKSPSSSTSVTAILFRDQFEREGSIKDISNDNELAPNR